MAKTALITGITGQDGAYLAEFLLDKGYVVHGIKRRTSLFNTDRIDHLYEDPHVRDRRFILHYGDLTDSSSLVHVMQQVQPDEVYNLGAQSHVAVSFEEPEYTANSDAMGTLRLLEAIRILGLAGKTRFYQASTSEMFGLVKETPQKETTPFHPRSPYGVAKLYAHWITVNYRESYGIFACNGILFNHESPMRGETFVTRKITRALARIVARPAGLPLPRQSRRAARLGPREGLRPRDVADAAAARAGGLRDRHRRAAQRARVRRRGGRRAGHRAGVGRHGRRRNRTRRRASPGPPTRRSRPGRSIVRIDRRYFRPAEVDTLLGDATKARTKLGWTPEMRFPELVAEMVREDLRAAQRDELVKRHGHTVQKRNDG